MLNDFPIKDIETAHKFFEELKEKKFTPNINIKRISTNLLINLIFKAIVYLPEERITFKYLFDTYLKKNNSNFFKNKFIPPNLITPQN